MEQVSGAPFAEHMDQTLLQPLGMSSATFAARPVGDNIAVGYRDGQTGPDLFLRDVPAGGLSASVMDLARFIQMIFAGGESAGRQILQPETVQTMLTRQNGNMALDFDVRIGLGWGLDVDPFPGAGLAAQHSGGMLLFHSKLIILPEHKLGVVVLSNAASGRQLVDNVAGKALRMAWEAKTGQTIAKKEPPTAPPPLSDILPKEAIAGHYATSGGWLEITEQGGELEARLAGRTFSLRESGTGWYRLGYRLFGLIPIDTDQFRDVFVTGTRRNGYDVLVVHKDGNTFLFGEKVAPYRYPAAWRDLFGPLKVENPDTWLALEALSLREEGGLLLIHFRLPHFGDQPVDMLLKPVSDDMAVFAGLGRGLGGAIRFERTDDGAMRARYSGYILAPASQKPGTMKD
jgi:hypothetical protein